MKIEVEQQRPAVTVALPGTFTENEEFEALAIIREALSDVEVDVLDRGSRTILASAEPPLRFIIELGAPGWVTVGGFAGVVAGKITDAAIDALVRSLLDPLVGSGRKKISRIWRALSTRFSTENRKVWVSGDVVIDQEHRVAYVFPNVEEVDIAVEAIEADLRRVSFSDRAHIERLWYRKQWLSNDEYFSMRCAESTGRRVALTPEESAHLEALQRRFAELNEIANVALIECHKAQPRRGEDDLGDGAQSRLATLKFYEWVLAKDAAGIALREMNECVEALFGPRRR